MSTTRAKRRVVQAWVEPTSDDPEAVSATMVAQAHLPAARGVLALRRVRLFELDGALPDGAAVAGLLHRSTQFYNPHKERCHVRASADERPPLRAEEHAVLVWERDGERRPAAERWWTHETGRSIVVREGVAWAVRFEPGADAHAGLEALIVVRDHRHGLLCNPHAQEFRATDGDVPLPWFAPPRAARAPRRRTVS